MPGPQEPFSGSGAPLLLAPRRELETALPTLFWGSLFGKPYVELFGAEIIAACPAHQVAELAPGIFYVQMTPDPRDLEDRYQAFEAVRAATMSHLGRDSFWDSTAGPAKRYRAPDLSSCVGGGGLSDLVTGDTARTAATMIAELTQAAVESLTDEGVVIPEALVLGSDGDIETVSAAGADSLSEADEMVGAWVRRAWTEGEPLMSASPPGPGSDQHRSQRPCGRRGLPPRRRHSALDRKVRRRRCRQLKDGDVRRAAIVARGRRRGSASYFDFGL